MLCGVIIIISSLRTLFWTSRVHGQVPLFWIIRWGNIYFRNILDRGISIAQLDDKIIATAQLKLSDKSLLWEKRVNINNKSVIKWVHEKILILKISVKVYFMIVCWKIKIAFLKSFKCKRQLIFNREVCTIYLTNKLIY